MCLKEPFFTQRPVFGTENDSEDDAESQNEDDNPPASVQRKGELNLIFNPSFKYIIPVVWFPQPKRMPDWLYKYFGDVIQPLILTKDGSKLAKPAIFGAKTYAPASFWVHTPEPAFSLSRHHFDPSILYRPRVFLWLPHFFVDALRCPSCRKVLEKNGALAPRRIIDVDHSYYIVTWAYYCHNGCKSHFHGWSQSLLNSLPAWICLSFPAVLSRKSGLSCNVISQLRVGNQHKMGPTGVRSLLLEMHTMRFNILQAQYMEALFEQV